MHRSDARVLREQAYRQGTAVEEAEGRLGATYAIGRMVTADEVAAFVTRVAFPLSVAFTGDVITCMGGVKGSIYYYRETPTSMDDTSS